MREKVLILIICCVLGLSAFFVGSARAEGCSEGDDLIVLTAPPDGGTTLYPSVMVRGYLCRSVGLVLIRNATTSTETIAETNENCDASDCTYDFAAPVRDLAPGPNRITAEIPGEDVLVEIDVIRTALAKL